MSDFAPPIGLLVTWTPSGENWVLKQWLSSDLIWIPLPSPLPQEATTSSTKALKIRLASRRSGKTST